jgi:4-amino-4-deoxy-L-arabinose transferase-like glycosyltransferase
LALLALASVLVLFADAGAKELHGTAVFYASLIRELLEAGDPMLIYTDERAYLLKPPLVVWSGFLSSELFGLNNFSVTLCSRLAGVGVVLLTYALLRRWWNHAVSWLAALAVLTNSTFVQFTATLRMDSLLMFGLLLSLVGWAYRDTRWSAAAIFGGITIAVLSKGPLGFAPVALILCHALFLRRSPICGRNWYWALLLLPIAIWYATLIDLHGLKPITELGADAVRTTAAPQLNLWQSAYQEYLVKPARRYWPWLPFILIGATMALRRIFEREVSSEMRLTYAWVITWVSVVICGATLKPDHDIRYLYPALPVLGLFAGISLAKLTRNRLPTQVPLAVVLLLLVMLLVPGQQSWRAVDTREIILSIRQSLALDQETLAIGGYPVPPDQPRRQNTHRDWIHFYTGTVPEVLSWDQTEPRVADFTDGVFLTRSRGHRQRMAELGLVAKYKTNEMIFALPK